MAPTAHLQRPAIASDEYRRAIAELPTGVTVITTRRADGTPAGTTVSAVTSVSLEPPLLLVCLARDSNTLAALRSHGSFAVNVLGHGHEETSNAFARSANDAAWGTTVVAAGTTGVPVLEIAHVAIECHVEAIHDGGDHEIVVGRVVGTVHPEQPSEPLLHHRGQYARLHAAPAAPATSDDPAAAYARQQWSTAPSDTEPLAADRRRRTAELQAVECRLPSRTGASTLLAFEDEDGVTTSALVFGDPTAATPLIAIHHACVFGDALGSLACDCSTRLAATKEQLAAADAGVLVYLKHDSWLLCDEARRGDLATITGVLRRTGARVAEPLEPSAELADALRAAGIKPAPPAAPPAGPPAAPDATPPTA